MFFTFFVVAILIAPFLIAAFRNHSMSRDAFAFNEGATGLISTVGSIVCGNVGIGTFLAIYLFTHASPVIGLAIVIAYTVGLILCSVLAPRIHSLARQTGTFSLVDMINARHAGGSVFPVWIPVAFIFVLRSSVQLTALAVIMSQAFELDLTLALIFSTLIAGSYTVLGGYKAATETDLFQSAIIISLVLLVAFGIGVADFEQRDFFDLGPYKLPLLIGIMIFVPMSPILAVDNWQRLSTARNATTARAGYLIAAALCGGVYLTIWWVGMLPGKGEDVLQTFRSLMPMGAPWLADILFMTCILSSIDTFVMPLVSTLAQKGKALWTLRLAVAGLFLAVGSISYLTGDLLSSVIAAFNSLTVFLPAVIGAFLVMQPNRHAAWASLNGGVIATLSISLVDINSAAILGFIISAIIYVSITRWSKPPAAMPQTKAERS